MTVKDLSKAYRHAQLSCNSLVLKETDRQDIDWNTHI